MRIEKGSFLQLLELELNFESSISILFLCEQILDRYFQNTASKTNESMI